MKWLAVKRWHMPIGELWAVRVALREARQSVFGLQNMLAQGFDVDVMQVRQLLRMTVSLHPGVLWDCTYFCQGGHTSDTAPHQSSYGNGRCHLLHMQALLMVFPQPLLCELKASCADALAELLDGCPRQSLSVKGVTTCLTITLPYCTALCCYLVLASQVSIAIMCSPLAFQTRSLLHSDASVPD